MNSKITKGKYVANCDMPIKYVFQLGGGIKGRTVKQGETVTVVGSRTDIDTPVVEVAETLHVIAESYFRNNFTAAPIQ